MPSALVLIAEGTEEMEFVITFDTLVRGGITCKSAFVQDQDVPPTIGLAPVVAKCSRGVNILPDINFVESECGPDKYDALIIPGGAKGAETLSKSQAIQRLIRAYLEKGKVVGMICAGSLAALAAGLQKQPLTSHPSVKEKLEKEFEYSEESVVVSGNLVTSRGPGTAFPFAFTLVEKLAGTEKRKEIVGPMVFPAGTPFL
jgi:protein DJ-1